MAKKKKPGVMIYFDPLHKEIYELDDHRAARLFRAIMDHANPDPELHREPDLSDDEVLYHVWAFVESDVNRDDETYRRKVGNKFSAFCRYCKENGYGSYTSSGNYVPPITRQEWDELGQPTYKQWSAYTLLAPAQNGETHTFEANAYNASGRMHSYAPQGTEKNASKRSSESVSTSDPSSISVTIPVSISSSMSETEPDPCAPPDGGGSALSPEGKKGLEKWTAYCRENGKKYNAGSVAELQNLISEKERIFGAAAVADLISLTISSAWRTIPWDRLERQRQEASTAAEEEARRYARAWNGTQDTITPEEMRQYVQALQQMDIDGEGESC